MKIAIAGASGLIGRHLVKALEKRGDKVYPIKHDKDELIFEPIHKTCDAVINLSGVSIMGRWTNEKKNSILSSREKTAKQINHFYDLQKIKPDVFISASGIGFYGSIPGSSAIEDSPNGCDFLAKVCQKWENATLDSGIKRVVIFRLGVVLAKDGGFFPKVKKMVKRYLGAVLGDGNQMVSWVHIDDVVQAFLLALDRSSMKGVYNLCSPNAVSFKQMMQDFSYVLKKPVFLKIPAFFVKMLMKEASCVVLNDTKAFPKALKKSDFAFFFDDFRSALESLE